jgi:hypothetical protein
VTKFRLYLQLGLLPLRRLTSSQILQSFIDYQYHGNFTGFHLKPVVAVVLLWTAMPHCSSMARCRLCAFMLLLTAHIVASHGFCVHLELDQGIRDASCGTSYHRPRPLHCPFRRGRSSAFLFKNSTLIRSTIIPNGIRKWIIKDGSNDLLLDCFPVEFVEASM